MWGLWTWLWGLKAEEWTALATVLLAVLTLFVVIVGWIQLRSVRKDAKKERTIAVCDRYDYDPILDGSARRLSAAGTSVNRNDPAYQSDVSQVLNYCDAISIGIAQGIYIELLARDYLEDIILEYVQIFLGPSAPAIPGIDRENFPVLMDLATRWKKPPRKPRYREGKGWMTW
jgi:hypothetical protein